MRLTIPTLILAVVAVALAEEPKGPLVSGDPARLDRVRKARMPAITEPVMFDTPEADAILSALEVFPPDNPWNLLVTDWPLHPKSKEIIDSVGANKPLRYNPDMAFVLVPPDQKKIDLKLVSLVPGDAEQPLAECGLHFGGPVVQLPGDGRPLWHALLQFVESTVVSDELRLEGVRPLARASAELLAGEQQPFEPAERLERRTVPRWRPNPRTHPQCADEGAQFVHPLRVLRAAQERPQVAGALGLAVLVKPVGVDEVRGGIAGVG